MDQGRFWSGQLQLNVRSNLRRKTSHRIIAVACFVWVIASSIFCPRAVHAQSAVPKYEVDPFWAKLPGNWVVGPLGGHVLMLRTMCSFCIGRKG